MVGVSIAFTMFSDDPNALKIRVPAIQRIEPRVCRQDTLPSSCVASGKSFKSLNLSSSHFFTN